jgi:imidazolonepropionase-like amidohydrolase
MDAQLLHLTPGIIDEHSHIALRGGVNEGTEASSAEVRMADVINPEDVSIYRQLASGVTAAQLLHGSANPIGGQSAIIKLRWGASAEGMLFEDADSFIKFALGENVKQSNWGDYQNQRFPQTRMGVEQVYRDYFTRAFVYSKSKAEARQKNIPFRTDLNLESISEILQAKRFITCHSYVQSEINMLMHVASDFKFKVNTFTHILEGYKVADKMKAHGVFASTFSDWWAYKNEVMEAIPYNAELLTRMGVITSINSDDAEMARRLNQEAAKTIKYGQLHDAQALALITANPAQMLHLNNRVGAIKVGMDADLVLWDGDPLSVQTKVAYTFIDGKMYFSQADYKHLLLRNDAEKLRLISKIRQLKSKGASSTVPLPKPHRYYHCETLDSE